MKKNIKQYMKTYLQLIILFLLSANSLADVSSLANANGLANSTSLVSTEENSWAQSYQLEAKGDYTGAASVLTKQKNEKTLEFTELRLGWLAYLAGDWSRAIEHYNAALEHNPKSVDAEIGLLAPLIAQSRWKEVEFRSYSVLEKVPRHYTAHLYLLQVEEHHREWQKMRDHADLIVQYYPSNVDTWVYLARSEYWLGRNDKTYLAYQQVLMRYPAHLEAAHFVNNYLK